MPVEAPQRPVTADTLATEVTKMQILRTAIGFQELTGEAFPIEPGRENTIVTGEQLVHQMRTVQVIESELVAKGKGEVVEQIEIVHGVKPARVNGLEAHMAAMGDY